MKNCEHIKNGIDIYLNIRPDGQCRLCRHAIYKKHYEKNREKVLERQKEYRAKEPEKVKANKRKWVIKNKERNKGTFNNLTGKKLWYASRLKNIIIAISKIKRHYDNYRSDARTS